MNIIGWLKAEESTNEKQKSQLVIVHCRLGDVYAWLKKNAHMGIKETFKNVVLQKILTKNLLHVEFTIGEMVCTTGWDQIWKWQIYVQWPSLTLWNLSVKFQQGFVYLYQECILIIVW